MIKKIFPSFLLLILLAFFLNGCGIYKRSDVKDNPVEVDKRVKQNIEEGKGLRFNIGAGKNSGVFDFASSNEMWRATIETLDFVSFTNASYSGGIIITDWFSSNKEGDKREIKITVRFLSNEIRADGIKVVVYDKYCETINNCRTNINQGDVSEEIKLAILKKASIYKNIDTEKKRREYRKKNPVKNKKIRN